MPGRLPSKAEAQRRADQIRAFRAELAELGREGVESPPASWLDALTRHHDAILAAAAASFDIDRTVSEKRMSIGMQLASTLGAAALAAAVVSFFYRIWGTLPTAGQVAALTAAPIAALVAMVVAARRERTLYVASLCAIVACAAFGLQTMMLGATFNLRGSPHLLAAWGTFALAVALPYRFALPLAGSVLCLVSYGAALTIHALGAPWTRFMDRPETLLLPAAAAFAAATAAAADLRPWARGTSLVLVLLPILMLSTSGGASMLTWPDTSIEVAYQVVAILIGTATIVHGVRRGHDEMLVIGSVFLGLFLLVRFVDWWWDWMPKYVFFLILAAMALGWLWLLRVFRRRIAVAQA